MEAFSILPDPQTNGGLLIAVNPGAEEEVIVLLQENGFSKHTRPIGTITAKNEKVITVK